MLSKSVTYLVADYFMLIAKELSIMNKYKKDISKYRMRYYEILKECKEKALEPDLTGELRRDIGDIVRRLPIEWDDSVIAIEEIAKYAYLVNHRCVREASLSYCLCESLTGQDYVQPWVQPVCTCKEFDFPRFYNIKKEIELIEKHVGN